MRRYHNPPLQLDSIFRAIRAYHDGTSRVVRPNLLAVGIIGRGMHRGLME